MALPETHTLTIDLVAFDGTSPGSVNCSVELVEDRLVFPLGDPTETVLPEVVHGVTNAEGIARFSLLPSSQLGPYKVTVGKFERVIEMPAQDVRLSSLPNVEV